VVGGIKTEHKMPLLNVIHFHICKITKISARFHQTLKWYLTTVQNKYFLRLQNLKSFLSQTVLFYTKIKYFVRVQYHSNILTNMNCPCQHKHSSLLCLAVNDDEKSFIALTPGLRCASGTVPRSPWPSGAPPSQAGAPPSPMPTFGK
jgi:hypothetical protein